jgi:hypothetical protein
MSQSNNGMSSFLAELAGEATQKLEALRAQQQDRQAIAQSVNGALERTFQFFNVLSQHLNAIEPDVPRMYTLDGKTQFSRLKWKRGMVEVRKQSLADNASIDHVYFQVRMAAPEPVMLSRRWERFDETRKELNAFGLKPLEDLDDLWRGRAQKDALQVALDPGFLIRMRFQGNYEDGSIELAFNNLEGFGALKGKLKPELLQNTLFDGIGRFLMGRSPALPPDLNLVHDFSRAQ